MSNKVGRPSKYKPEYCEMLIKYMAQGYSFEAFAGIVRTTKQTIYTWTEEFPEFLDAKEEGFARSREFWEKQAIDGLWNIQGEGSRNLNNTAWVFNMKNRFGWRDKQPDEASDVTVNVNTMSDEQLKEILKKYSEGAE